MIRGEGEKSYHELVNGKNKSQIKGLSLKKGKKIFHNPDSDLLKSSEINKLSISWDLINPKRYIKNRNFNIITSRGCPFKCAFCYNALVNNTWRGWDAEKCIQEFDRILEFGTKKITFYDDIVDTSYNFQIPATFKVRNITEGRDSEFEICQ